LLREWRGGGGVILHGGGAKATIVQAAIELMRMEDRKRNGKGTGFDNRGESLDSNNGNENLDNLDNCAGSVAQFPSHNRSQSVDSGVGEEDGSTETFSVDIVDKYHFVIRYLVRINSSKLRE